MFKFLPMGLACSLGYSVSPNELDSVVYFSEPGGRKGKVVHYHENNLPLSLVSRSTGCWLSERICSEPALDRVGVQQGHVPSHIILRFAFSSLI